MNLCDINEVQALLSKYGFHFSKSKGQNFLIQDWVPKQIVSMSGINHESGVLEIGPGFGCLTSELCHHAGRVVAVEVDETLRPVLNETLGEFGNLDIIFGDILKQDICAIKDRYFPGLKPAACANLPYYITSPILAALLESRAFSTITVMVQKEVAERICSGPKSKDYSAFSIFCQYYARPSILFDVPPHCFIPQPKVTSAVIRLDMRADPVCEILDEKLFFRVVKASFAVRRKTLLNGLSMAFNQFSKQELCEILEDNGLSPQVRGEDLDIRAFASISNTMYRRLHS